MLSYFPTDLPRWALPVHASAIKVKEDCILRRRHVVTWCVSHDKPRGTRISTELPDSRLASGWRLSHDLCYSIAGVMHSRATYRGLGTYTCILHVVLIRFGMPAFFMLPTLFSAIVLSVFSRERDYCYRCWLYAGRVMVWVYPPLNTSLAYSRDWIVTSVYE